MIDISALHKFLIFWFFILGLCIGSFLNVVVLRGLSGESIVFPSSKCPVCNNKLKWWMNIPLLSYIFLKGKCGFCKTKISIQYPIVEAFTGVLFSLICYKFFISPETIFYIIAVSLLIVMCVCDIKENVIFDIHSYIFIISGVILNIITGGMNGFLFSVIGAITGFLIYEILARSGYLFAGQRAFGEGDSLIAAGIGAFFGWKLVLLSVLLSIFIMAIFTLPYFICHSYKNGKKRTVKAIIAAFILIVAVFFISKTNIINDFISTIIFLIFVIASTLWCVKQILSDMKEKDENGDSNFCILPFGPSMGVSFLIIMFFAPDIEKILKTYFI